MSNTFTVLKSFQGDRPTPFQPGEELSRDIVLSWRLWPKLVDQRYLMETPDSSQEKAAIGDVISMLDRLQQQITAMEEREEARARSSGVPATQERERSRAK